MALPPEKILSDLRRPPHKSLGIYADPRLMKSNRSDRIRSRTPGMSRVRKDSILINSS